MHPTVRITYDEDTDILVALAPGVVIDGQSSDATDLPVGGVLVFRDGADGPAIGFAVEEAFDCDVFDSSSVDALWGEGDLRFDAPTLGLSRASIAEIVMAAQHELTGSTPDVQLFDLAVQLSGAREWEDAEQTWRQCLAAGELKAHYGLGYTLMELGRPREAFGHFVTYTQLTPGLAWAWSWRARAALAIGRSTKRASALGGRWPRRGRTGASATQRSSWPRSTGSGASGGRQDHRVVARA